MTDLLLAAVIFDCITHIAKRRNTRIEVDILGGGGVCKRDDDTLLEIISTRDVEHKGLTIAC